ncbi:HAD hydrolase family protein [Myxococcota bacterium]|nr:HAD hydrolase family protein [Myxococcota bacterium]
MPELLSHDSPLSEDARKRLSTVKALVLDCDGVLTPGDLYYDENGKRSLRFHTRDGLGIALLRKHNVPVAVLSGRPTDIAAHRLTELGVQILIERSRNKSEDLKKIAKDLGVTVEECAFMGDDLPDLAAFAVAGVRVAVGDAAPELVAEADFICKNPGGKGAIRDFAEAQLKSRGLWEDILKGIIK